MIMAGNGKKLTRRQFIKKTTVATAAICAAGVTPFNILPAKAARKIKLRAGTFHTEEFINTKWARLLAEKALEKSNGEIVINVFPNSQLGGEKDLAEGVRMATVDIASNSGSIGQWVPGLAISEFPFFYEDYDHAIKAIQGPILEKYRPDIEKAGFHVLGAGRNAPRQLYAKKPITKLEHFKGLKIRVQEIPVYIDAYKALGASPTPIAAPEIYSALQTGIVDAQDGGPDWVYSLKSYEILSYMMMTSHIISSEYMIMSKRRWDKLPEDVQKVIQEAADESTAWYVGERLNFGQSGIDSLIAAGMKQIKASEIDKKPMIEAVSPVHERYAKEKGFTDLLQKVRGLV
jgi:tripartite ATP-independent transporter DctP family solute receptor